VLAIACVREAAVRFISESDDDAALKVDAGCAATLPRPGVFVPIAPAPAASGAEGAR
jgi:hypothetical protein